MSNRLRHEPIGPSAWALWTKGLGLWPHASAIRVGYHVGMLRSCLFAAVIIFSSSYDLMFAADLGLTDIPVSSADPLRALAAEQTAARPLFELTEKENKRYFSIRCQSKITVVQPFNSKCHSAR